MPNPRLATRYAKSLIGLAQERGELATMYEDMLYLQAICKSNKDFVNLLRSPVIRSAKKEAIITAITKDKISKLTASFAKLLTDKGREEDLPEIVNAVITQYNEIKGIQKIKLTTAVPVSENLKTAIVNKVKANAGFEKVEIESKVNEALIGGFVLEYNNNLVDASILRDLKEIKKQFKENVYIHNIR